MITFIFLQISDIWRWNHRERDMMLLSFGGYKTKDNFSSLKKLGELQLLNNLECDVIAAKIFQW